jgi:hypothetical protein
MTVSFVASRDLCFPTAWDRIVLATDVRSGSAIFDDEFVILVCLAVVVDTNTTSRGVGRAMVDGSHREFWMTTTRKYQKDFAAHCRRLVLVADERSVSEA